MSHAVQKVALNAHVVHVASHATGKSWVNQTHAGTVPIGNHPVGTPQAPTAGVHGAVLGLSTCPVCENDEGFFTLNTPPVFVQHAVAWQDAVGGVEADRTTNTLTTDCPVSVGAVLGVTPRALLEDNVIVAPEAFLAVTGAARLADG